MISSQESDPVALVGDHSIMISRHGTYVTVHEIRKKTQIENMSSFLQKQPFDPHVCFSLKSLS